ncbi:Prefoldin [Xylaria arbuscula]|nr:Prefoldin [Xylaria arbuscula]
MVVEFCVSTYLQYLYINTLAKLLVRPHTRTHTQLEPRPVQVATFKEPKAQPPTRQASLLRITSAEQTLFAVYIENCQLIPTMSISNEALQKLLREVETQAIASQQQIALTRTQQAAKQREMRMAQLTRTEISSLPSDTNVYEGVGKMFISLPVAEMKGKLETQIKELEGDVEGLGKRLHYLEVSQKNSKDQIDRMLRGGVGAS